MLPKNRLGTAMLKKLRVYPGTHHEHAAQQPTALTVVGKHGHPSGPFIESLTVEQE
jgi:ribosomal protein L13